MNFPQPKYKLKVQFAHTVPDLIDPEKIDCILEPT